MNIIIKRNIFLQPKLDFLINASLDCMNESIFFNYKKCSLNKT
jgi:hypothetical protein